MTLRIPASFWRWFLLGHLATDLRKSALIKDLQAIVYLSVPWSSCRKMAKCCLRADRLPDLICGDCGQVAK
jgi:hypothetical protein